jgi:predicted MFS family arabinose efflux permease
MRSLLTDKTVARALLVLSIGQVAGWGTISLPAILGSRIAGDLHMDIAAVFAGSSVLYVVMGLGAPFLAKPFTRYGARRIMAAGTLAAVPGFVALSLANGPGLYFAAWMILGVAGGAMLTTAAHIMLNEIAGRNAKGAITAMMLVTGLSSSIFWPITAVLSEAIGWRGTCLVYAATMIAVCFPLYVFGLPRRTAASEDVGLSSGATAQALASVQPGTFYLIVMAVALNGFVTVGLASVVVELLKSLHLPAAQAIAFGSSLGVLQVSGRIIDFFGGGKWDGLTTGLVAGLLLPLALLVLMIGGGTTWSIAGFIVLYGLASGALSVARATIPLVFYDKADYARAASRIALPLNLMFAIAPPILAGLLVRFGSMAPLALSFACSCSALPMLFLLARRRPARDMPVQS